MAALLVIMGTLGLTGCSGSSTAKLGTPDFYWQAARETYAAGDYLKTIDHLDRVLQARNEYTARALPWSLVLTSGVAAGYMELADSYASGAHARKANAAEFRKKAAEYRAMASPLVLRVAQNVEKLDQLGTGSISLVFSMPRGTAAPPALLGQIASGVPPSQADADEAVALAIQRNIVLSVCLAIGAPNAPAKAAEALGHASTITPRPVFGAAIAQMLDNASALYARRQLDEPEKVSLLKERAQSVRDGSSAMVVRVQSNTH
jgi:hypothetical protein